jgi:hypothetical protein
MTSAYPTEDCIAQERRACGCRRPRSSWRSSRDDETWEKLPFYAAHDVDEVREAV